MKTINKILSDKLGTIAVNFVLFLIVLDTISERLYPGEYSTVVIVLLALAVLLLVGRWVFLAFSLRKSKFVRIYNNHDWKTRIERGEIDFYLSIIAFMVIMVCINRHGLSSITIGIVASAIIFLVIGIFATLFLPRDYS